jgi:hypothetical protein
MEPDPVYNFTIGGEQPDLGEILPRVRKIKHKEKPRSYFSFLLSEIDEIRGYKYRYGIILIPLKHILTYVVLLVTLWAFLFLLGFIIERLVIPDSYQSGPLDITVATFWGYIVFSGIQMMFVAGSWARLLGSVICCDRPSL